MEQNPFPGLKISPFDFLNEIDGRQTCPKCKKSRKYYCYNCYVAVESIQARVPRVQLPLKVDIIKHPSECDGKSTAAHAGILAPDCATVHTYPCIPTYTDPSKVVLVFPGENSITMEQLAHRVGMPRSLNTGSQKSNLPQDESVEKKCVETKNSSDIDRKENAATESHSLDRASKSTSSVSGSIVGKRPHEEECTSSELVPREKKLKTQDWSCEIERVVFIDSTWAQTKKIYMDERLRGLQCIELNAYDTKFWRHQRDKPSTYLATIEAVYYFFMEFHRYFITTQYEGEYDNLLFFFCFMYQKIRTLYDGGKNLRAYKGKDTGSTEATS